MKKGIWFLAIIFLVSGCSGSLHSSLVEMEVDLASPLLGLNDDIPVVYPSGAGGATSDPMVSSFGPSWENLEDDYSQYSFNP